MSFERRRDMNAVFTLGVCGFLFRIVYGDSRNMAEYKLVNSILLKNYSKQVLPLADDKKPVTVTFDLVFRRLVDVDEKNQVVTFSMGVIQFWNNPLFRWDPNEHMGIRLINLHKNLVWVPDICLYNMVDDSGSMSAKIDTAVKIDHSGNSSWLSPFMFKSECKIDVTFFPFDEQVCELKFGSWTYNGNYINIVAGKDKVSFAQYVADSEWSIINLTVQRNVTYYPCCSAPYPTLTYRVVLKRRALFYLSNMIIPCAVIALLAFLSFCLPVESNERISLVITVLLAMTVFLLLASSSMPPTSEVISLLGKFYLVCTIEIAACLIATFLTIKWYYNDSPIPKWIQVLVNELLAKVLRVNQSNCLHLQTCRLQCAGENKCTGNRGILKDMEVNSDGSFEVKDIKSGRNTERSSVDHKSYFECLRNDFAIISDKVRRDYAVNIDSNHWKFASRVLDRFFFFLFLISFLVTAGVIFANAMNSHKHAVQNYVSSSE